MKSPETKRSYPYQEALEESNTARKNTKLLKRMFLRRVESVCVRKSVDITRDPLVHIDSRELGKTICLK
jgi:hypothetical protein